MARTSKTKIGGGEGEQGERMMRADASGAAAVARGHESLMAQKRANAQQGLQAASMAGDIVAGGEQRNIQREGMDLEAAKAGFERNVPGGGIPPQGQEGGQQIAEKDKPFTSDREAALEAEMAKGEQQPKLGPLGPNEQQNLRDATQEPLEMDSTGTWRPTKAATKAAERKSRREDFEADTERIRARAYSQQVAAQAQKALMEGNEDAYKEGAKQLANLPNSQQKRFDRMMKDEPKAEDWADLSRAAKGNPEPGLIADIESKTFSPRVQAFSRALIGKDALESIVNSKGSTNFLEIDWTNPKMQEFENQRRQINAFAKMNPAMTELAFIRSTDDKMRFINVLAAAQVLFGMSQAPIGKGAGDMNPATAPQGQPGAPQGGAPGAPDKPNQMAADLMRTIPDDFPHRAPLGRGTGAQRWEQQR